MSRLAVSITFLVLCGQIRGQTKVENLLLTNASSIRESAELFGVSPRLLAGVIYAEQSLNVKPGEIILDVVFAKTGYNSSVGLAQVKVQTARWIETQVNDSKSQFHLGVAAQRALPWTESNSTLIDRLGTDSVNILYAGAYLAMIERLWGDVLKPNWFDGSRQGIVATVYSLGLLRSDGSMRQPHENSQMNVLGKTVQEFCDSFMLRAEFPN